MIKHSSIVFVLFWMVGQFLLKTRVKDQTDPLIRYDTSKAIQGEVFFHRLIYENDSYTDINEENMSALIHFFFREAYHNGRPIDFSTGMFVLHDSTERFFTQLMKAKDVQVHSNEHRSGYLKRLQHFVFDGIKYLLGTLLNRPYSPASPFIYLRGDESSHFRERGNRHERWHVYPAYGMDFADGRLPNQFSHLLFGQLNNVTVNVAYRGDRIYIKPERYGLQEFRHYIGHTFHFIKTIFNLTISRLIDRFSSDCHRPKEMFHEWIDQRLTRRWTQILSKINTLTSKERRQMESQALSFGIYEIYRQALLFPSVSTVNQFRLELEDRYGPDVCARKSDEIIFTTEQLLKTSSCSSSHNNNENEPCQIITQT